LHRRSARLLIDVRAHVHHVAGGRQQFCSIVGQAIFQTAYVLFGTVVNVGPAYSP
jgi:hypothetical protein